MMTRSKSAQAEPRHPFGELLAQFRARKPGLTQTRLAELSGYDQAILVRMSQGKKDLTGPSGRERVVRLIETLTDRSMRQRQLAKAKCATKNEKWLEGLAHLC